VEIQAYEMRGTRNTTTHQRGLREVMGIYNDRNRINRLRILLACVPFLKAPGMQQNREIHPPGPEIDSYIHGIELVISIIYSGGALVLGHHRIK